MKKFLSKFFAFALVFALMVPSVAAFAEGEEKSQDIVILYTNDVHCAVKRSAAEDGSNVYSFGYSNIAAYKKALEETHENVLLVDAGDHVQGGVYGVLSKGEWIVDLMNATGYDFSAIGNHEFDYEIPQLEACMFFADYDYLSCNFINLETGEPVVDAYRVIELGDKKVAFIGITTPETFTKSTPAYFKNEEGEFIYSFCEGNNGQDLYDQVQKTLDEIATLGVDYVIALTHLGIDPASEPWTVKEVIANTTGIDVAIDGHSHSVVEGDYVADKAGNQVLIAQTGTKFANFGQLTIAADGTVTTALINEEGAPAQDEDVNEIIDKIVAESEASLAVVAGSTDFPLYISNPDTGARMIRNQETNAGDFVADAYRAVSGADVAAVNGGGIRINVPAGDVTVETLMNLHPFGNELCVVKTTGQHIADLLEMAVSKLSPDYSTENGGFMHVSGMTYDVDLTVPTTVVTSEQGEFVEVSGDRRVFNIQVLDSATGEYAPLDLEGEYTIASHNYMLKSGGDGLNMFTKDELLVDGMMLDYQVVMTYFDLCGGKVPAEYEAINGQGRITMYTDEESAAEAKAALAATEAPAEDVAAEVAAPELPQTGVVSAAVFYCMGAALICGGAVASKKNRKED